MLEKDVMMQKIISEKDNLNQKLLQPQISYDQSGLNSIISTARLLILSRLHFLNLILSRKKSKFILKF